MSCTAYGGDMVETFDVRHAEQLVHGRMGGRREVAVFVQRRVHEGDTPADAGIAPLLER